MPKTVIKVTTEPLYEKDRPYKVNINKYEDGKLEGVWSYNIPFDVKALVTDLLELGATLGHNAIVQEVVHPRA